jgi:uncharacterized protein
MDSSVLPVLNQHSQSELIWAGSMPRSVANMPMMPYQTPANHGLYKLVLVVAEACNLRCTYCYAEGGPYGKAVSVMTQDIARQAVRHMFGQYNPIRTLQFFGGEPTLNIPAMRAGVDEVRSLIAHHTITSPPRFAVVTNGFRMSDALLDFYSNTEMMITVSHDGPEQVQNALRPGKHGETSFTDVSATLKRLKQAEIPFDIQCTYTAKHSSAGYRVPDLLEYFHDIGARLIHIVPVSVPKGNDLDVYFSDHFSDMVQGYRDAVKISFRSLQQGHNIRFGMLEEAAQLLKPGKTESNHYCNAGVTTLTVAANGDVYPCFMFINKHGFQMGHIKSNHALAAFARDPQYHSDFGCPGREFLMSGQITPFRPDEILKRAVVDEFIKCVSEYLDKTEAALGIAQKRL